jgi:hypothetical protein
VPHVFSMKINTSFLASCLLLSLGGTTPVAWGTPRVSQAKPIPQVPATENLSLANIEKLRKQSAQARARVRQARKRAAEANAELAATLRQMSLSPQDWKGLFRSMETSRRTILPLLEQLPVSVREQGTTAHIKGWLGEMYKVIAPQTTPQLGEKTLESTLQGVLALRLILTQCTSIEVALLHLETDVGDKTLLPEVEASLAAIRATHQQSQFLLERMVAKPSKPSHKGRGLANAMQL